MKEIITCHLKRLSHYAIINEDFYNLFHLSLSIPASQPLNVLAEHLQNRGINQDKVICQLHGSNISFSRRKDYKALSTNSLAPPPVRSIWKSCILQKHMFFFWLLLQNMLITRETCTKDFFCRGIHNPCLMPG